MNVLMVEPGKVPYETEIGSDLARLYSSLPFSAAFLRYAGERDQGNALSA